MRIHAINCGWMRPLGGRFWDRTSQGMGPARLACRCLVVEHPREGPILVDTGLSPADLEVPGRLPATLKLLDRPRVQPLGGAVSRLRALGFAPGDVRHIVMTHLDFDHAGGLTDFPGAQVHVTRAEAAAARARRGLKARMRWRPAQFPPSFVEHDSPGEEFFGLGTLSGLPGGLRYIPLPGHSPGHAGVLIPAEQGWVLHAGDTIFDMRELAAPGMAQPMARAYEAMMQVDAGQRRASADALRALARRASADLTVLCTHDPYLPPAERLLIEARLND